MGVENVIYGSGLEETGLHLVDSGKPGIFCVCQYSIF